MSSTHPPVVHALAQIVFPNPPGLEEGAARLKEALFALGYVRTGVHETQEVVFALGAEAAVKPQSRTQWIYADANREFVFVLSENSLVLHTTAYVNHEDFFARVAAGMSEASKVIHIPCVDRIGLRYTNLIQFGPSDQLAQLIAAPLLGFPFQGSGIEIKGRTFATSTLAVTTAGTLAVRSTVAAPGQFLPPDLNADYVRRPKNTIPDRPGVIVDIDHFTVFNEAGATPLEANPGTVVAHLCVLHQDVRRAFEAAFTPNARG